MKKKRNNPYREANEEFLAVKAQEDGFVALGNGAKRPTPRSIVYVHYTGRLRGCWQSV